MQVQEGKEQEQMGTVLMPGKRELCRGGARSLPLRLAWGAGGVGVAYPWLAV